MYTFKGIITFINFIIFILSIAHVSICYKLIYLYGEVKVVQDFPTQRGGLKAARPGNSRGRELSADLHGDKQHGSELARTQCLTLGLCALLSWISQQYPSQINVMVK